MNLWIPWFFAGPLHNAGMQRAGSSGPPVLSGAKESTEFASTVALKHVNFAGYPETGYSSFITPFFQCATVDIRSLNFLPVGAIGPFGVCIGWENVPSMRPIFC